MAAHPEARGRLATDALFVLGASLVLGVTCARLGVSASEGLRAAGLLGVSILPLGDRLLRGCRLAPGERLVASGLVGFPASAAAYYLLSRLGVPGLFPWVVVGLLLFRGAEGLAGLRGARGEGEGGLPRGWSLAVDGPQLLLVALVLLAALYDRRPFLPVPEGVVYRFLHRDDLTHQTFYFELLRGIPPRQLPYAAGIPFPPYHILPYVFGVLLNRYAHIPIPSVHHAIAPMLHLAVFCGAVLLGLKAWTGSRSIAAASLVGLFFVTRGVQALRHPGTPLAFDLFRIAESMGAGLAVSATVLCLLALYERSRAEGEPSRRLLLLSALLAGLLFFFKAQVFLFFGPAYVLSALTLGLLRRSRDLAWAAALAAGTAAALRLGWQGPTTIGTLGFVPGALAGEYGLLWRYEWVPWGLGFLPASVSLWWQVAGGPVLLLLYLARQAWSYRTLKMGDALLALALPGSLLMVAGLVISDMYGGLSTMAVREARDAVWPLAMLGEVAVLGALARRFLRNGDRLVLAGALVLGISLAPFTLAGTPGTLTITAGEAGALAFLRDETPPDSVVIHARSDARERGQYFNKYAVVSGLGGRRSVLEAVRRNIDPDLNRQRDIRRLFDTTDPDEAGEILGRYSVNYVLEYESQPLRFGSPSLRTVYDRGGVRVYEVLPARP